MKKIVDIFRAALDLDGFKALSYLEDSLIDLIGLKADNMCVCCCCQSRCC